MVFLQHTRFRKKVVIVVLTTKNLMPISIVQLELIGELKGHLHLFLFLVIYVLKSPLLEMFEIPLGSYFLKEFRKPYVAIYVIF